MRNSSSIFSFKDVPRSFFLAAAVIVLAHGIELFVLPIHVFTFRVWEAVSAHSLGFLLPGPFYPNMRVSMVEQGDLGAYSESAVQKSVRWETDRWGYRRRDEDIVTYDIVIVGDSNIAGSASTQEDMFSEQLERASGMKVYPFAPASFEKFMRTPRFRTHPPKIVIVESIERNLKDLSGVEAQTERRHFIHAMCGAWCPRPMPLVILCDRISKMVFYRFAAAATARLQTRFIKAVKSIATGTHPDAEVCAPDRMLFRTDEESNTVDTIDGLVEKLKSYQRVLAARGIRFIFFPLPDKETVYWERVPLAGEPVFLQALLDRLRSEGIEVIDVSTVFADTVRVHGPLLYHTDDTHWNREGVRLSVECAMRLLRNGSVP